MSDRDDPRAVKGCAVRQNEEPNLMCKRLPKPCVTPSIGGRCQRRNCQSILPLQCTRHKSQRIRSGKREEIRMLEAQTKKSEELGRKCNTGIGERSARGKRATSAHRSRCERVSAACRDEAGAPRRWLVSRHRSPRLKASQLETESCPFGRKGRETKGNDDRPLGRICGPERRRH